MVVVYCVMLYNWCCCVCFCVFVLLVFDVAVCFVCHVLCGIVWLAILCVFVCLCVMCVCVCAVCLCVVFPVV